MEGGRKMNREQERTVKKEEDHNNLEERQC